nr:MAG TPA: hypothetical protein [Caudoviricetes sp.]
MDILQRETTFELCRKHLFVHIERTHIWIWIQPLQQ